jgi:hypothetical protein
MNVYKLEKLRCIFEIEFHNLKNRPTGQIENINGIPVMRALSFEELTGAFNQAKDEYFAALDEMSAKSPQEPKKEGV